ncbi:MAG: sensor histidine kinase [Parvibaculum sp.]|nr:sensor histidine kinase [Parvibaculum sp.]
MTVLEARDHIEADSRFEQHTLAHLRQAEREVAWLRWLGIVAWVLILLWRDMTSDVGNAWAVLGGGLIYTAWSHWRIDRAGSIRAAARLTSVGDPILAALMCAMTGGIGSLFYPFFYFTLLATVFRLGGRDVVLILALNAALSVVLFFFASAPDIRLTDLTIAIFYLVFATLLGVMLARWARKNLSLATSREKAFRLARDRTRLLLRRLIGAQEEERRLVAGDLHDRLGHQLFVLQQGLGSLADHDKLPDDLKLRLKSLGNEAQACANDVRLMMNDLRPTVLDDFGFCEAVREYVARMSVNVPFDLTLKIDDTVEFDERAAEAMLFRIVQESLINIRKHAKATRVVISLAPPVYAGGGAVLTISDDGEGFDPHKTEPGHLGLLTMRERAEALGGTFEISTISGEGTTVTVTLPEGHAA